ncbi:hypothetical protein K438DRAFT_1779320 [Mycena galopus ATCC 62051]|nr:hypothetical protein K438DRAFT_1779320 [Mycena galopus ATCC 62051]
MGLPFNRDIQVYAERALFPSSPSKGRPLRTNKVQVALSNCKVSQNPLLDLRTRVYSWDRTIKERLWVMQIATLGWLLHSNTSVVRSSDDGASVRCGILELLSNGTFAVLLPRQLNITTQLSWTVRTVDITRSAVLKLPPAIDKGAGYDNKANREGAWKQFLKKASVLEDLANSLVLDTLPQPTAAGEGVEMCALDSIFTFGGPQRKPSERRRQELVKFKITFPA